MCDRVLEDMGFVSAKLVLTARTRIDCILLHVRWMSTCEQIPGALNSNRFRGIEVSTASRFVALQMPQAPVETVELRRVWQEEQTGGVPCPCLFANGRHSSGGHAGLQHRVPWC